MGVATSTTHFSTDIVVKDQPAWIGFTHQGEGDMSIDNLRIEKLDPRPVSVTSTQAAVFPDACKPTPNRSNRRNPRLPLRRHPAPPKPLEPVTAPTVMPCLVPEQTAPGSASAVPRRHRQQLLWVSPVKADDDRLRVHAMP